MKDLVYIIILNYNNWPDTLKCLQSIKKIDYPNYKIILVDNNSAQKAEIFDPDIYIIYNSKNLGFAGGNNIGIKYALENKADYILLLNNDTIVSKDFLTKLVKEANRDLRIGILGPKIYFVDQPKKIWFLGGKFSWFKTRWTKGRGHLGYDIEVPQDFEKKPQKVDFITGCALLIKRQVIEKIGLLPEDYFFYYEDVDWCLSARKAGFFCEVVPKAEIWHKISASTSQLGKARILRYHFRNASLLIDRQAPLFFKLTKHFWAGWLILKQAIKIIFIPSSRPASREILKGISDYYQKKFGQII